jgi:DNA-binding NarL/FixJ family response regulator
MRRQKKASPPGVDFAEMKRVLILGDDSNTRTLRLALQHTHGLRVVGVGDGGKSSHALLIELHPDVVLVDELNDPTNALERLREAANLVPGAKRLLLTDDMHDDWLEAAFDAGADAALSKAIPAVALGPLLRETVHSNIVHRFRRIKPAEERSPLTSREIEILALVARGYTNGRIAYDLCIAEQTVKFHLSNTYRKLGVANRTQASRYAYLGSPPASEVQLAS